MFKHTMSCLGLALSATVAGVPASAQQDEEEFFDRTPQDCIQQTTIRKTKVLDDQTVLFYLRGGRIYQNILEQNCPGLGRAKRFLTKTSGARLCDIDTLTVLDQFGSRFEPGFTCRLGDFHPIMKAEAELLEMAPDEAAAASRGVRVEEVEVPEDEAADAEAVPAETGSAEAVPAETGSAEAVPAEAASAEPAGEARGNE